MKKTVPFTCLLICSILVHGQKNHSLDIGNQFIPAGYMGCTQNINIQNAWTKNPHSAPICYKMSFTASCPIGWAGVYFTNTADDSGANWGQSPGIDLSKKRFTKLTFWARGQVGGEAMEFGSGGIDNTKKKTGTYKYKDSYLKTILDERIAILDKNWKQYTIDLTGKDFSSVIGGFYWSASWNSNSSGLVFYLDDIKFEQ